MEVLVIGGTGHIGSFLIPQLVADGHEVVVLTRGERKPSAHRAWDKVRLVKGAYKRGSDEFPALAASVGAEAVVDILGPDVPAVYAAVKRACRHFVACGSVWMLGPAGVVPTPPEEQAPCPFEYYAMRWRELKETRERAASDGIAFTAVLPPNICGPGKVPIDVKGGRDVEIHKALMRGEPVVLPERCNTLIAPCDASDVAQAFARALRNRDAAAGEFFNAGAPYAMTLPRFVEAWGEIFGVDVPVETVSAEEFYGEYLPDEGANYHFRAHMAPDISKTRAKLGYVPEFTSEQSMSRAADWMRARSMV